MNWTYDEFVCFVLIYISNSDMDFSDKELHNIVSKYGKEIFDKQNDAFEKFNDYQCLTEILKYRSQYFSNEAQINKLLQEINDQFKADGVNDFEKEVGLFLEKIFRTDGF
jgi:hypothetical protein